MSRYDNVKFILHLAGRADDLPEYLKDTIVLEPNEHRICRDTRTSRHAMPQLDILYMTRVTEGAILQ